MTEKLPKIATVEQGPRSHVHLHGRAEAHPVHQPSGRRHGTCPWTHHASPYPGKGKAQRREFNRMLERLKRFEV